MKVIICGPNTIPFYGNDRREEEVRIWFSSSGIRHYLFMSTELDHSKNVYKDFHTTFKEDFFNLLSAEQQYKLLFNETFMNS